MTALRDVTPSDLPIFFRQQTDRGAHHMVAFIPRDPDDEKAFMDHWAKILADNAIQKKTILFENQISGYLVSFNRTGRLEVGYWIGREYWGKGIATEALRQFLDFVPTRPLYGCTAFDNAPSIRVLEKCGFKFSHHEKTFAKARGQEIELAVLILQ